MNQRKRVDRPVHLTSADEAAPDVELVLASKAHGCLVTSLPRQHSEGLHLLDKLARIVGDPAAPESSWMNACTAAGEKSLVRTASPWRRLRSGLIMAITIPLALLTLIFSYACAIFSAGHLASVFGNVDLNTFLRVLDGGGDAAGLATTWSAGLAFWLSMVLKPVWLKATVTGAGAFLAGFVTFACLLTLLGGAASLAIGMAAGLAVGLLGYIGGICSESMPRSFNVRKFLCSLVPAVLLPGLFMVLSLVLASQTPNDTSPYSPASASGWCFFFGALSLCVIAPGLALARASKAQSLAACATLSTLVQVPLMLGVFVSAAAALAATIGGAGSIPSIWASLGAAKFISLSIILLLSIAGAVGGGMLGAKWNALSRNK